jgi:hypothetical protein
MIDFTTPQLSWIVVSAVTIGGGGYMSLNNKVDELDKKLAVSINTIENMDKGMDKLTIQLSRIEEKLDQQKSKR